MGVWLNSKAVAVVEKDIKKKPNKRTDHKFGIRLDRRIRRGQVNMFFQGVEKVHKRRHGDHN
jgi:hypothetical protein